MDSIWSLLLLFIIIKVGFDIRRARTALARIEVTRSRDAAGLCLECGADRWEDGHCTTEDVEGKHPVPA